MNAKDEDAACVYLSNAKPYPEMSAGSHDQQRAIVVRAFSWSVPRPLRQAVLKLFSKSSPK